MCIPNFGSFITVLDIITLIKLRWIVNKEKELQKEYLIMVDALQKKYMILVDVNQLK